MTSGVKSGPISASGSSKKSEMAITAREWLELIEREYLTDFITAGGGAVKFVVGDTHQLKIVARVLEVLSERHGLAHVKIDAATTRLHMIQDVFFAIARALDWNAMAQDFVESLFRSKGYQWPRSGEAAPIQDVAECNRLDVTLLRRDFRQWLTAEVMRDTEMAQDFRVAMTQLCLRRLEPEDPQLGVYRAAIAVAARRIAPHRSAQADLHHRQDHPPQRPRNAALAVPMAEALRSARPMRVHRHPPARQDRGRPSATA